MELDRGKDEHSRRDRSRPGPGMPPADLIRYGAAITGVALILIGVFFAITVFRVVLNVIESPDTLVANLDAWTNAEPEPESTEPAASEVPPATPEAPPASDEETTEKPEEAAATTEAEPANPLVIGDNAPPPVQPITGPEEWENSLAEFVDLIREGRMGRIAGAIIIVLLLSLLSRIPFAFMRIGAQLLSAAAKLKV